MGEKLYKVLDWYNRHIAINKPPSELEKKIWKAVLFIAAGAAVAGAVAVTYNEINKPVKYSKTYYSYR